MIVCNTKLSYMTSRKLHPNTKSIILPWLRYNVFSVRYALRPKKYFKRVCKMSHQKGERAKAGNILKKFCSFSTPPKMVGGIEVTLDSPPPSATLS